MVPKSIFTKTKLSKTQLWLVGILLVFVLLLVFIWLWYSLELTRIDTQLKTTKPSAAINGKRHFNQITATNISVNNPA